MADNNNIDITFNNVASGDSVLATLVGIIAAQAAELKASDVRGALEGDLDRLSDRLTHLQDTVDKNHKYEIKKFSEMKRLIDDLSAREDANSATLKEMSESIAGQEKYKGLTEENNRLAEENNRLAEENNRLREAQIRSTEESNRRIDALERQISRLENAVTSSQSPTAGTQQQNSNEQQGDNVSETIAPVIGGASSTSEATSDNNSNDNTGNSNSTSGNTVDNTSNNQNTNEDSTNNNNFSDNTSNNNNSSSSTGDPQITNNLQNDDNVETDQSNIITGEKQPPQPVIREVHREEESLEPVPEPEPEPVPEPKPVPEPVPTKDKLKIKLLKKSMDDVRILAEPKLPWYKRLFNFANRHPVITTLVGAGIGAALTFLSGPAAFLMAPSMTLTNFIGNYVYVLAGGAVMGLGGGIAASAVSGLVMKGKKGRLYGKFAKQYKKCKSIEMSNERLEAIVDLSQNRAKEMHEKARVAKGHFRGIKKFINRKLRDANLKIGKIGRVYRQRGQEKYNNQVDSTLKTKTRLNELEAKPNRRGKTKSLAIAGYFEKKKRLNSLLERGKISAEEYEVRMEDLDTDASQLKGGEPGLSSISDRHRTYDKEAYELIESVKGKESETMRYVRNDIAGRHAKVEEVIKDFINPEEAEQDAQALESAGKVDEAKLIRMQVEKQRREMEESHRISDGEYPILFKEEIATDAEAEETQEDENTSE